MTQEDALTIMKTGVNVFLTGEPGSGKTFVVNQFVGWLKARDMVPAITASTGVAATQIGGSTIHSWSGIGIRKRLTDQDLERMAENRQLVKRVRGAHVLIIDEISMLSARTFSLVEIACRALRESEMPFGGLQVIVVGDFFQLPPVIDREDDSHGFTNDLFDDFGSAELPFIDYSESSGRKAAALFAFDARAWDECNPTVCYLSEQHRQEDAKFLGVLSAIRRGKVTAIERALLIARRPAVRAGSGGAATDAAHITKLFSRNIDVDRMNERELAKLHTEVKNFVMVTKGPAKLVDQLKRGCLSPEILSLKVGARVMFTKNDVPEHRFVNGTIGEITGFYGENGWPVIRTVAGREIIAEPQSWHVEDGEKILADVAQVPLRLAWAITVHKSQGMSLDVAHIDLGDAFEYGQGYVALSRLRTLEGLSLAGLNERALQVHPEICVKDVVFRTASAEAEKTLHGTAQEATNTKQDDFVKACGGIVERRGEDESAGSNESAKEGGGKGTRSRKRSSRGKRWERTLELVREGVNAEEAAREQERTVGTICDHLEELVGLDLLTEKDLAAIRRGREDTISEVCRTFQELDSIQLKPVFERLEGCVPYDIIRLARLFYRKEAE